MRNVGPIEPWRFKKYRAEGSTTWTTYGQYKTDLYKVISSSIIKGDKRSAYPWSYTIDDTKGYAGKWRDRNGSYGGPLGTIRWHWEGVFTTLPLPVLSPSTLSINREKAYNKALEQLNERVRGGLDLSVALAEMPATFKMIKSILSVERYFKRRPWENLYGKRRYFARKKSKNKHGKVYNVSGSVADRHLEFTYGIKPLISDVYNAANELLHNVDSMCVFKGRGSITSNTSGNRSVPSGDLPGYTDYNITLREKNSTFCGVQLSVTLRKPTTLQQKARWSSLNPVSVAWELIPYSFVVDWFLNVGNYIRDIETQILYNSTFVSGYRSDLTIEKGSGSFVYNDGGNPYFTRVVYAEGSCSVDRKAFARTLLSSYPLPYRPRIQADLGSARLLSAAALLRKLL